MKLLLLSSLSLAATFANAVTRLNVQTSGGNASSPHLYGVMFEEINNSGDGALYGQMLRNNGFQGEFPGLTPYEAVGSCSISIDQSKTIGAAEHFTIKITANQTGGLGHIGLTNGGYYGIRVTPQQYMTAFFLRGAYHGPVNVSLVSPSGELYGRTVVHVTSDASRFVHYKTSIDIKKTGGENNLWKITFDNTKVTSGSINVGFPTLFPHSFMNRANGMNQEVGSAIHSLQPSFLRFPGGNNLEGATVPDRWIWNNTIGPIYDRPGRQGDWKCPNTDGLGLLEFMQFCQDVGMSPLLAIWDGVTLGGSIVSGDDLTPHVKDALNELEFLLGDKSTKWGARRAALGYPEPFDIPFIEIGNEGFINGGDTYPERFHAFYSAIHSMYPNIIIIASTNRKNGWALPKVPQGVWQDVHLYQRPEDFVASFNEWDNWNRSHPVIVGEYAAARHHNFSQISRSYVQASVAEAVYMIGIERNSDVVKGAAYAPLLEHFGVARWSPNLFGYDAMNGVTRSTSYYVQHMFSVNRGDTIMPVKTKAAFGPVYWVASRKGSSKFFVKMANYGEAVELVTIQIDGMKHGNWTVLTGAEFQSNHPGNVSVVPTTRPIKGDGGVFHVVLPAWSVAVLAVTAMAKTA